MPKRNKLLWILAIVLSALLFILVNSVATLIVLVAVVVTPVISMAVMVPAVKKVSVEIVAPEACQASDTIDGTIAVDYSGVMPISSLYATIVCRNAFIDDSQKTALCLSLHRGKSTFTFHVGTECCGMVSIGLSEAFITDAFGIFERKLELPKERVVVVTPDVAVFSIEVSSEFNMLVDSDHYSMNRPGNDPSETFAMREYRAGDPIKSIHWKMSEKTGNLMVRELGLPIVNQMVLFFEALVLNPRPMPTPQTVEAMASVFISASHALVEQDTKHTLCWRSAKTGGLVVREIEDRADLDAARAEFLDNTIMRSEVTTPAVFRDAVGPCPFAHVVMVSAYVQPDIEALFNNNRVTVVAFSGSAADASAGNVIPTTPATYKEDLRQFEV